MSYTKARKKAADAKKKTFKYTTKDGERRTYKLVEGKKGVYKRVEKNKKKASPRRKKSSREKSKKIYAKGDPSRCGKMPKFLRRIRTPKNV